MSSRVRESRGEGTAGLKEAGAANSRPGALPGRAQLGWAVPERGERHRNWEWLPAPQDHALETPPVAAD